jgi:hypothetical protein
MTHDRGRLGERRTQSETSCATYTRSPRSPRATSAVSAAWTRRVQLVRRDGRDVSTLYGREGGGVSAAGAWSPERPVSVLPAAAKGPAGEAPRPAARMRSPSAARRNGARMAQKPLEPFTPPPGTSDRLPRGGRARGVSAQPRRDEARGEKGAPNGSKDPAGNASAETSSNLAARSLQVPSMCRTCTAANHPAAPLPARERQRASAPPRPLAPPPPRTGG